jgi:hypothetical protein
MLWRPLFKGQGGRCNYKADVTKVARCRGVVVEWRLVRKKSALQLFRKGMYQGHGKPQNIEAGHNGECRDRGRDRGWTPGWPGGGNACEKLLNRLVPMAGNAGEGPGRFWLGFQVSQGEARRAPPPVLHLVFRRTVRGSRLGKKKELGNSKD